MSPLIVFIRQSLITTANDLSAARTYSTNPGDKLWIKQNSGAGGKMVLHTGGVTAPLSMNVTYIYPSKFN